MSDLTPYLHGAGGTPVRAGRGTQLAEAAGSALGLTVTSSMLTTMQSRASSGPFKTAGDYATNSPGDWDRVSGHKDDFVANPSSFRWAGPEGSGAIPYGQVSYDPSYNDHWRYILSAAMHSMVADDASVRSAVATELLAQSNVSRLDFYDETQWQEENGTDINPIFETATFMAAMLSVMDWVEIGDDTAFSSAETEALHDWFFGHAQFLLRELTIAYDKQCTLDESVAPPWPGESTTSTFRLAYDGLGSDTIGTLAVYFNNRRNCMIRTVGMIAQKLVNAGYTEPVSNYGWTPAQMLTAAKNLAKGWLVYSCYPEGYNGEFERIGSSGGIFYPWQTLGPILSLAHVLAVNGDASLFDYTTRDGHENSACSDGDPDKSLEWMTSELLKYTEQNVYNRTKDGVTIGLSSQTGGTEWAHDQTAAIILPHASDTTYIKPALERTEAGMSGWLSGMAGYGGRTPWVVEWGVWPAAHFMFNGVSV